MTLSFVGVAMATTPLGVGLALFGVALGLYAFWDSINIQTPNYRAPQPATTAGCACTPTVTMGADSASADNPSGAAPAVGNNGGDSGVIGQSGSSAGGLGGAGGFSGVGSGFGAIPSCGLTGIEFVWFVGLMLRRRNRKRSAQ
jgi:hypothetical protein